MFQDDEIKLVRKSEEHRGRVGVSDPEALEERKALVKDILALAREDDIEGFKFLLIQALGMDEKSEAFQNALHHFRYVARSYRMQSYGNS